MQIGIIALAGFLTSALTLFSGFGLGTLLMPVMALFFPLPEAIGLTAVVHLLNNLFKLALLGRHANRGVVIRFGVPAILSAFAGAWLLNRLTLLEPWVTYTLGARTFPIDPVRSVIGLVILGIVGWEISPYAKALTIRPQFLFVGGLISGFFGGLSGHQGAFRSTFLLQCGLTKEAFLGTGVVLACLVDFARLISYRTSIHLRTWEEHGTSLVAAIIASFLGAFLANRLGKQWSLESVRRLTTLLLFAIALGMITGLV